MDKKIKDHNNVLTEEVLDKISIQNGNKFEYKLQDVIDSIAGSGINGESVLSCAGYLVLTWHALSKLTNKTLTETPIVFEDIYFKEVNTTNDLDYVTITILPGTGNFEICSEEKVLVTGNVRGVKDISKEQLSLPALSIPNIFDLDSKDIYQVLSQRGYDYKNENRSIMSADLDVKVGRMVWLGDWIAFIDGILKFDALSKKTNNLYIADRIARTVIDPTAHFIHTSTSKYINVYRHSNKGVIVSGGVEISGLSWNVVPKMIEEIEYEKYGHVGDNKNKVFKLENAIKEVERAHAISTGHISTIQWVESPPLKTSSQKGLCHVYYVSLNYQDLVHASGRQLPGDGPEVSRERTLGMEFSGLTPSGRRVMGIVPTGALATDVIADDTCLWDVPANWPLECAATVPMAYCIAYYALLVRGQMKPRDNIVVYCGSTDIGQAIIRLSIYHGCRVFSSYNNREQRQYIPSRFLEIRDRVMGHDWHPDFEKMVLEETAGKGVDIIVNLLGPKKLPAAASCLAKGGRILDIIQGRNCSEQMRLPPLVENQTYQSINMASITQEEKKAVSALLAEGIRVGDVWYSTYRATYAADCLKDAFRYLMSDNRIAKVIVTIRKETDVPRNFISAAQRVYLDADKSYLVVGGDNVPMEFGQWLISRGASKIVFNIDNDTVNGYQTLCIKRWQEQCNQIKILTKETREDEPDPLWSEVTQLGPVGGIFDLTTLGRAETHDETTKNAIEDIKALSMATREDNKELDYFVVITSHCSDTAISAMKNVMESRKKEKSPGIIIQVRSNDDPKEVASYTSSGSESKLDDVTRNMSSFLNCLDTLLAQPHSIVSCVPTSKKIAV